MLLCMEAGTRLPARSMVAVHCGGRCNGLGSWYGISTLKEQHFRAEANGERAGLWPPHCQFRMTTEARPAVRYAVGSQCYSGLCLGQEAAVASLVLPVASWSRCHEAFVPQQTYLQMWGWVDALDLRIQERIQLLERSSVFLTRRRTSCSSGFLLR